MHLLWIYLGGDSSGSNATRSIEVGKNLAEIQMYKVTLTTSWIPMRLILIVFFFVTFVYLWSRFDGFSLGASKTAVSIQTVFQTLASTVLTPKTRLFKICRSRLQFKLRLYEKCLLHRLWLLLWFIPNKRSSTLTKLEIVLPPILEYFSSDIIVPSSSIRWMKIEASTLMVCYCY